MRIVNEPDTIDGVRVVQNSEKIAEALSNGEIVYHWEAGESMKPLINHMEYCKIIPLSTVLMSGDTVDRGDAVFCKMRTEQGDYYMVHQVWEVADCGYDRKTWYKIGSTGTTVFGWSCDILGKAYGTDIYQEVTPEIEAGWRADWEEKQRTSYQQD